MLIFGELSSAHAAVPHSWLLWAFKHLSLLDYCYGVGIKKSDFNFDNIYIYRFVLWMALIWITWKSMSLMVLATKGSSPIVTQAGGGGLKIYSGNCHCGGIYLRAKIKNPIDKVRVASCNCSICTYLRLWTTTPLFLYMQEGAQFLIYTYVVPFPFKEWFHTKLSEVAWRQNDDDVLTSYEFNTKQAIHKFCSTCGVSVFNTIKDPATGVIGVNVRTLNGVDLASLKLRKVDMRSRTPDPSMFKM